MIGSKLSTWEPLKETCKYDTHLQTYFEEYIKKCVP
jgi:hypothetical protein